MSFPTWTPDALRSEARAWRGLGWRLVEAQHRVATLPLVDSLAEQALLEDILEETKPSVPSDCAHLDYLLATPFRYGPYPYGSRFRKAGRTPGVWYGAEHVETAIAEMVFYRFLFYADAPDVPWPDGPADYTGFSARLGTQARLDLTMPPMDADVAHWTNRQDYAACQALATDARDAGIEIIRYRSVRDAMGRANLAVLACAAFAEPAPATRQTWRIRVGAFGAQAVCDWPDQRLAFPRDAFDDPRLEGMAWERA